MNLATHGADPHGDLLFANFNQDRSSLVIGTRLGYKLFSLGSVEQLEEIHDYDKYDVSLIERLFSSSLVALVSLSTPRKLKVCHFKKGTEICNYNYPNTILAVKLNRMRLLVVLEESLYIHNIRDMKVMHTIKDTPPNPNGVCALSDNSDNCYLAYPGNSQIGNVQIYDGLNLRAVTVITAHDAPVAALAFNPNACLLATASEKGTVIRVFAVPEGSKLFEFRRGIKRCAVIHSLAFSCDSMFLASSSNTETVHVFKLETEKEKPEDKQQSWLGYFGKALMTPASYLPAHMTDVFTQGRAFATAKLPHSGMKNVCALAVIQKLLRILVASADGYLYMYDMDPQVGQECPLLRQHALLARKESHGASSDPEKHVAGGLAVTSHRTPLPENSVSSSASAVGGDQSNLRLKGDSECPSLAVPIE